MALLVGYFIEVSVLTWAFLSSFFSVNVLNLQKLSGESRRVEEKWPHFLKGDHINWHNLVFEGRMIAVQFLISHIISKIGSHIIFKIGLNIYKVKVSQIASYFRTVPEAEFHAHSVLKILYCILDIKVKSFLL